MYYILILFDDFFFLVISIKTVITESGHLRIRDELRGLDGHGQDLNDFISFYRKAMNTKKITQI